LAHENISHQSKILEAVKSVAQDARGARSVDQGFALPFLDFITSRLDASTREDMKLRLQHELHDIIQDSSPGTAKGVPLMTASRESMLQESIVRSLYYPGMKDREGRITETFGSTFRWIFEDSPADERKWANFKDWLQGESQLYWITGKAGSGKSTLMKYICEEDAMPRDSAIGRCSRSAHFLDMWAKDDEVVVASFYFWNASVNQQRTQAGLFRTLLHQLLKRRPELISVIAPKRWETLYLFNTDTSNWSEEELGTMLEETVALIARTSRLCIFVDGLDEFDGEPSAIITIFKRLMTNPKIKLCLASRPWVEFEDAFSHGPSLKLQHLTYPDMKEYVSSHMAENEGYMFLCQREPVFASQLQDDIIAR
jgi:hypothetical protein